MSVTDRIIACTHVEHAETIVREIVTEAMRHVATEDLVTAALERFPVALFATLIDSKVDENGTVHRHRMRGDVTQVVFLCVQTQHELLMGIKKHPTAADDKA